VYSFLDGFYGYHQIQIAPEDYYKMAFIIDWRAFVGVVMPFELKNAPPTYQRVVSKVFKDYLDDFMKIFLDDFMVFSDLDAHLSKLWKYFKKCHEYKINLNPEKCAFMVFSDMILRFIISKEGKLLDPKKVEAIIKMPIPKNPRDIQVFNGLAQFYRCFVKKFAFIMASITKLMGKLEEFIWTQECQDVWETIKRKYVEILIAPKWEKEFHVQMDASNLAMGAMLAQNLDGKCD